MWSQVTSLPDFLRDEMRELNKTSDIDRGQFALVNVFCH